jgi:2-oxoglutarate ferredoxin oxidoreductase subunit beta
VYGLTRGQVAPTATKGYKSKTTPSGIVETSVNALLLAVTQGATFVAQSFAGNMPHVAQMITAGMKHKGFSVVNVLQPCVTFNKVNTYGYYFKNTYALKDHDPRNWNQALEKAAEPLQEKFPLGVIYESDVPAYHEQLPQLSETALVRRESASHADELIKYFA